MNYYIESDLGDYGVRDVLGNARENLTWILKNRDILELSKTDNENLLRCCKFKMWSSSMCKWLDSVRTLNDESYANYKTEKQIKAVHKKIERETNLRIAALKRHISDLEARIEQVQGFSSV